MFSLDLITKTKLVLEILVWAAKGSPAPPPNFLKQLTIKSFANKGFFDVFIETGTYQGAMIWSIRNDFQQIFSIELNHKLFLQAQKKFSSYPHIHLIEGDSAEKLKLAINKTDGATLFWLDGHFSGEGTSLGKKETPIIEELKVIFQQKKHIHYILIDDARLFNGTNGYPKIQEIQDLVTSFSAPYKIFIKHDIIRLQPLS